MTNDNCNQTLLTMIRYSLQPATLFSFGLLLFSVAFASGHVLEGTQPAPTNIRSNLLLSGE